VDLDMIDDLFDWRLMLDALAKLLLAYAITLPVAWERERAARSAGLRTFPLVALASCGFMLLATMLFPDSSEAQARVFQGLITGIGFVGGGAILKTHDSVHGTATAASIWNTGAIGTAVAYGRYEIAVVLSTANFLTLRLLSRRKDRSD
jgi:putative Mg2+ transporter-C (MgtC) family protein